MCVNIRTFACKLLLVLVGVLAVKELSLAPLYIVQCLLILGDGGSTWMWFCSSLCALESHTADPCTVFQYCDKNSSVGLVEIKNPLSAYRTITTWMTTFSNPMPACVVTGKSSLAWISLPNSFYCKISCGCEHQSYVHAESAKESS